LDKNILPFDKIVNTDKIAKKETLVDTVDYYKIPMLLDPKTNVFLMLKES